MKQDYKRIEELVDLFFEGQTTNEEERELYTFFLNEDIPEHLLPYRQVFAFFETGIKEEFNHQTEEPENSQLTHKKRITIWASVAASLLLLISFGIYHFTREKEFNPYEGSYIIRNGVKITDPKIVIPEIEKTLYMVQQQEKKQDELLRSLEELNKEDPYEKVVREIKQQQLKWVEQVTNEDIRKEIMEILNINL